MSYSIDVNILVYASDEASPFHPRASEFLQECSQRPDIFCLTWTTLMAYLRVITNPVIASRPFSPDEAMANIDALLALPQVRLLTEQADFWTVFRDVAKGRAIRRNRVPDAHLAALLRHHGVRKLYTNDADFRKYEFLDVENPFAKKTR